MTFGRVAEALPRAIRLVGWPKLAVFFFFFFFFFFFSSRQTIPARDKQDVLAPTPPAMMAMSVILYTCVSPRLEELQV